MSQEHPVNISLTLPELEVFAWQPSNDSLLVFPGRYVRTSQTTGVVRVRISYEGRRSGGP